MTSKLKRVAPLALAAALFCTAAAGPGEALADPSDDDQNAAARDPDYAGGKAAIDKKNWAEAVKRFNQAALRDPRNADIQNYLGFAHRNLKQFDLAFKHYRRALELNPRHRGAHEYIGEAYLQVNDLPSAEKHLAQLRSICLLQCEELADLEKAVKEYKTRGGR